MRTALLFGLMFVWSLSSAQTVLLPSWVADSLIFETRKGRSCEKVITAQQNEIQSLGKELVETNKALKLSMRASGTLDSLVNNARRGNEVLTLQFDKDRRELKRKLRKRMALIIGETILLIILLI